MGCRLGLLQGLLGGIGGGAQRLDLSLQLGGLVGGELLLGLLQGHLRHAGFDLQALELFVGGGGRGSRSGGFGLGGLGFGGTLGAGNALGFLLFFGAAQALLAPFETLLGMFGLLLLLFQFANLGLGRAVVLHQRNARRADIGTGAALDAVEQVVRLELVVLLAEGEEVQLLRQQASRAGLGAIPTADAGHGGWRRGQFLAGRGQQAVAGLDQRHIQRGQGKAHHRPAHDQAVELTLVQAGKGQQLADRGADQGAHVAGAGQRFTCEGGDALDQWLAVHHRVMDGHTGTDVLADDADIGRQTTAGHFPAGENLDQLFLATGRVLGREHLERVAAFGQRGAHGGDGFWLVVLDTDQHFIGLDQLHQNVDAGNQLGGVLAHQQVIGGDVGLALGAVDHQGMNLLRRAGLEFDGGGETGAAEAVDAGIADFRQQRFTVQLAVVRAGRQLAPLILAVAVEHDGRCRQAGNMRVRLRADKADEP